MLKEQAKTELISDFEKRFSNWVYRFIRSHQELLQDAEYRFLYYEAKKMIMKSYFDESDLCDASKHEKAADLLDYIKDLVQKDDILSADQYAPIINEVAMLLKNTEFRDIVIKTKAPHYGAGFYRIRLCCEPRAVLHHA